MPIALYIQVLFNVFRILLKRVRYGSRFSAPLIQRISLFASIDILAHGRIKLGRNICAERWCSFLATGHGSLEIGDRTYFNRGCMISCQQKVVVGKGCLFGPDVKIYDNDHKFTKDGLVPGEHKTGEVIIGDGTWIAANVVILRGSHIGSHCVIGAGVVVKGNIPDHSLVTMNRELVVKPIQNRTGAFLDS